MDDNNAIAFASSNAADVALSLIAETAQELQNDPQLDVVAKMAERYAASAAGAKGNPPDCEFLILRIENGVKRLAHISDGSAKFVGRAYIGDPSQYKKLLELKRPFQGPTQQTVVHTDGSATIEPINYSNGLGEFIELGFALQALVEQRRNAGVGAIAGNIIRVVDAKISRKLEYLQTHEASITEAEGAGGYSLLASNSGKRGIGIYYIAGELGFVMISGDSETCRKLPASRWKFSSSWPNSNSVFNSLSSRSPDDGGGIAAAPLRRVAIQEALAGILMLSSM